MSSKIPPIPAWRVLKPLMDLGCAWAGFLLAYWARYELQWIRQVEPQYRVRLSVYLPSMAALGAIVLLVFALEGAYGRQRRALFDDLWVAARASVVSIATMIVIIFVATPSYYSRLIFGYAGIFLLLLMAISRTIEHLIRAARLRRGRGVQRVLIVQAGEVGHSVMRAIVARPELGYRIMGYVDDDPARAQGEIGRFKGLGTIDDLPQVIRVHQVDVVIITLPWQAYRKILKVMRQCEQADVRARVAPDLFQMTFGRVVVENLDGIPLLSVGEPTMPPWQRVVKRGMDLVLAGAGIVLLSPLLAVLAIAIKLDSPGPVVFKQPRLGRDSEPFVCWKFRSMVVNAEARLAELQAQNEATGPLFKMKNDPRRTRVGQFLRRTSLDELPQLWNVLRGEMSLVGPRPPIPSEVAIYEPWHMRRLEVRPGLTGLWQVSGRSDLTFDEMVLLDVYYVENWSPLLDVRILLKTLPSVVLGSGAY